MANGNLDSGKTGDGGGNSSKEKQVNRKSSPIFVAAPQEMSGHRKSYMETSLKRSMSPGLPSMANSEHPKKQSSTMPLAARKLEKAEGQKVSSSVRSERVEKLSSSCSSELEKSVRSTDLSDMGMKRNNTVKKLRKGSDKIQKDEDRRNKTFHVEKKKLRANSHSYQAWIKKLRTNLNVTDKSPSESSTDHGCGNKLADLIVNCGQRRGEEIEDDFSRRRICDRESTASLYGSENLGNNEGHVCSATGIKPDRADRYCTCTNMDDLQVSRTSCLASGDAGKTVHENFQTLDLEDSNLKGRTTGCCTSQKTVQGILHSNGKRHSTDKDPGPFISSNDISPSIARTPTSLLCSCKLGKSVSSGQTCFKRQRCCNGKGCESSYHNSCLDPSLDDFPLGGWHCSSCVRKNILLGVHSVSEGIESIWDARQVEALDNNVSQTQRQYFVKYKGLAHVHNRWVPESILLVEAPSLVAKFNQRNQGSTWRHDWMVPHRLLQKRPLISSVQHNKDFNERDALDASNCQYEWLVKWRGLGYEHATWELENSSFICCPDGQSLIQNYETRHKKEPTREKVPSKKLSQLPGGCSSELDNYVDVVNKLHQYKDQNAIILDDKERMLKIISFIRSFPFDICRPFLIISTSTTLYSWEEEFLCFAKSLNVVVYNGNREIREHIRRLEFYEESGCIMFQVLLTSPEVVVEDLELLACIGWEVIVVDECQCSRIASHLEQIKMLHTGMRLLVASGQLKGSIAEYINMLSFLESHGNSNINDSLSLDSNGIIGNFKERLAKYVAYDFKTKSSRFVEYWVPAEMSNVQLEQYCATLLSNSSFLCSSSKSDPVGALGNLLLAIQKCCDHPYVANQSLQMLLNKDQKEQYLDIGIKASGKLILLEAMLSEMKKQGLKVLVLFQVIGGCRRDSLGDILDDFLWQRFGSDSYERIDTAVVPSKKQSALHKFNKEQGRFVLLLEKSGRRLPSIKLSSLDAIIVFNSDWNLMNDVWALQKMTFDRQVEQIKLFRLYSTFTMEEKLLILSTKRKLIESNVQNIGPSTSQMLLMWGTSYLFAKLDEFHMHGGPTVDVREQSHLNDVLKDFLKILAQKGEDNESINLSIILQVKPTSGFYVANYPLFGEQKIQIKDDDLPHIFWAKLLEGRHPQLKFSADSTPKKRKRLLHFDEFQEKPDSEDAEVDKKLKRVVNDNVHQDSLKGLQEGISVSDKGDDDAMVRGGRKPHDSQRSLCIRLKPEVAKLCEVLHLSKDVKAMVERFLEYVLNNHHVGRDSFTLADAYQNNNCVDTESKTWLQAFQISLCWTAASLLKHEIKHTESMVLAKQHLNYSCEKEEAEVAYSMLMCLKEMFLHHIQRSMLANSSLLIESCNKGVGTAISCTSSNPQRFNIDAENLSLPKESLNSSGTSDSGKTTVIVSDGNVPLKKSDIVSSNENVPSVNLPASEEQIPDIGTSSMPDGQVMLMGTECFCQVLENIAPVNPPSSEKGVPCVSSSCSPVEGVPLVRTVSSPNKFEGGNTNTGCVVEIHQRDEMRETVSQVSEIREDAPQEQNFRPEALENITPVNPPSSEKELPCVSWSCSPVEGIPLFRNVSSPNKFEGGDTNTGCVVEIHQQDEMRETVSQIPEIQEDAPQEQNFRPEVLENITPVNPPSSEKELPCVSRSCSPVEGISLFRTVSSPNKFEVGDTNTGCVVEIHQQDEMRETVSQVSEIQEDAPQEQNFHPEVLENITPVNPPSSEKEVPCVSWSCSPAAEIPLMGTGSSPDIFGGGGTHTGCIVEVHQHNETRETVSQVSEIQEDLPQKRNVPTSLTAQSASFPSNQGPRPMEHLSQVLNMPPIAEGVSFPSNEVASITTSQDVQTSVTHAAAAASLINFSCTNIEIPVVEPVVRMEQLVDGGSRPTYLPEFPSVSENGLNVGGQTTSQSSQACGQLDENQIELPNQNVLSPRTNAAFPSGSSSHSVCNMNAASSQMPPHLLYDPLQNEIERIHKEKDTIFKTYEETRLQLESDYKKEIEEAVSQIREKYDAKRKEKESDFLLKKQELDSNHNQVLKNKLLAETFWLQCMDNKVFGVAGMYHVANSSIIQCQAPLSLQPIARASNLPRVPLPPSPGGSLQTNLLPTAQTMDPYLQSSLEISSDAPTRPLYINTGCLPTGNIPARSEICGPAPHLQQFRSSVLHVQSAYSDPPAASPSPLQTNINPFMLGPTQNACQSVGANRLLQEPSVYTLDHVREIFNRSGASHNIPSSLLNHHGSNISALVQQGPRDAKDTAASSNTTK